MEQLFICLIGLLQILTCFSNPPDVTACVEEDVNIPWVYTNAADMDSVNWEFTDSSNPTKTILLQSSTGPALVVDGFNVVHNNNNTGNITITNVTTGNTGSYSITVTYTALSAVNPFIDTVEVSVNDPPSGLSSSNTTLGTQTRYTCIATYTGDPAASLFIQINGSDMTTDVSAVVNEEDTVKCCISGPAVQCISGVSKTRFCQCVQCPTTTGPPPQDPCPIWCIVIVIIAVVVALIVIGCIIGCCYFCCGNCKECFEGEAADCKCCQCCDNDVIRCKCCCSCFGDQKMPFWYYILWWTVIGSPVAFGIFIVSKCTKQGKEDAGKKDNSAEKPKAKSGAHSVNPHSNQATTVTLKNEHKDHGSKVRPQPSPPGGAKGTSVMHGREGSDGAVSREDVEMQESDSHFTKRPMPAIHPARDSKGRGLSANFEDTDHPLENIDTPAQRKGALEALNEGPGEESIKVKKKKKKSKNRDEE